MTARILVVDDVPANVKLLEVRLLAEYFEVLTASNGADALEACENGKIDVVLLDVMMPDMDGFEVCRRLKSDPATSHIPVVMVTALDHVSDRIRGLEAGADDFLTKPVNDLQLMTRVRSLVRLKMLTDELRLRASTTRNIGIEELLSRREPAGEPIPSILLIDERPASGAEVADMLAETAKVDVATDPHVGFFQAAEEPYECVLVSTGFRRVRSAAALLATALARPHALRADHPARRTGRGRPHRARAGTRHQRLPDPADRPPGAYRAAAHAGPAQALQRSSARQRHPDDRDGGDGRADRPAQPTLSRQSSADAVRPSGGAAAAAVADDHRPRPLQVGQRHLRPRRRRRGAARIRRGGSGKTCAASTLPAASAARSSSW